MALETDTHPGDVTLGPVLFNWAPEAWRDFYFRIADEAPITTAYLGEVICSKRGPQFEPHIALGRHGRRRDHDQRRLHADYER